jgi:hypothetical protein
VCYGVGQAKALTTSVDHSAMCLDVAMANFRLNGIPLAFSADKSTTHFFLFSHVTADGLF